MREEAFHGYVKRAKRKAQSLKKQQHQQKIQQQQQKQKQRNPPKQEQPAEGESSWTASLPGWVTSTLADVSAEVDALYDWLTDEDEDSSGDDDEDDDIDYRKTQFWELAKLEGDEKWLEWLETHIWTVGFLICSQSIPSLTLQLTTYCLFFTQYVGLSAPMLGAVNPLRSVISGENMGYVIESVLFGFVCNPIIRLTNFFLLNRLPLSDEIAREMELSKYCS